MALELDVGCLAFFFILIILGPHFYQMSDDVDWVGWCHGLNLGMGIALVMTSIFQWKQNPDYAFTGVFLGALSIYLSTATFPTVK